MKVYIVEQILAYEGSEIIAVFGSLELANACVKNLSKDSDLTDGIEYAATEYEVRNA